MNKMIRSLALVLVLVMCIGLLAACGKDGNDETTNPSTTTKPVTTLIEDKEVVGVIKEVSDSFVKLELYTVDGTIDYVTLDVNTLTLSGETDYVYINSTAVYDYVSDGKLVDLKKGSLEVGHIVAVVKTVKGIQQFIVLNYTDGSETTNPTDATNPNQ